jgi:hypothetical protein
MQTRYGALVHQTIRAKSREVRRRRRIAGPVLDPISALFALRSLPLRRAQELSFVVLAGNSLYRVELEVMGRERVYTKLGPRDALKLQGRGRRILDNGRPHPRKKKVRRVTLWLSADAARIPLRLRGDTKLGPLQANLSSYTRPARGLRVRPTRLR